MNCVFCNIIKNNDPYHELIWEDELHIAFLDAYPEHEGHLLVTPRMHTDYLFDLDDTAYEKLFSFTRVVGRKLKQATHCTRVVLAVGGYEIPHVHIHLIPSDKPVQIAGLATGASHNPEILAEIANQLRTSFQST